PDEAVSRAVELVACGADGLFTFEGPHDVFLPLTLAATGAEPVDLMTNVAIALPRSPVHLAHAAYDLQLLSRGRFRLGLGSQTRAHIDKRYGGEWSRPAARMREVVLAVNAILDSWQHGTPLRFEGEFTTRVAELETELHLRVMSSPDSAEGMRARLDRRKPVWSARLSSEWEDLPQP
ncbi:LLM class flavin-dependent oxidoreductase, partial [Nocardia gipuzkoensis]